MKFSLPGKFPYRSAGVIATAVLALLGGTLLLDPTARADLAEGRDYALVAPNETSQKSTKKTEVIEFFSWGCPHCAAMLPHITRWSETLPASVEFVKVPVAFGRREWGALSRAYYALQFMGELKRLDAAVFDSIHAQGQQLFTEPALTAWAAKQGVDAAKFKAEFNSERVTKAVMDAEVMSRDLIIDSVPKIVVARRYKVIAEDAKSYDDLFAVANRIVDKAAKEKSAKR